MKTIATQVQIEARYYKIGDIHPGTKNIWLVLHGYGQLAHYFIQHFDILDNGSNCIIAPEALSKFYLQGFSGRVGATWMTKENRLVEIENYTNYLQDIYQKEVKDTALPIPGPKINLLGFSQGCVTAVRWLIGKKPLVHRLVLWGGSFPADIDMNKTREILSDMEIVHVYGKQDPFITENRLKEHTQLSENLGISPKTIRFEGVHTIDRDILLKHFS